eukprot:SM000050S17071  [mRNA]  locus=s50:748934:749531:- [translate_table: standard]
MAADPAEDPELRAAAAEDLAAEAAPRRDALRREVLAALLDDDGGDGAGAASGCILEVRAGTGGEEASLFAMDLFRMYSPSLGFRSQIAASSSLAATSSWIAAALTPLIAVRALRCALRVGSRRPQHC